MTTGRVFIIESPNPLDLLKGRCERLSLEQVCRQVGHDPATFLIRDLVELRQTLGYISSIKGDKTDKTPLFIHISAHGNESEIVVGADRITWDTLAGIVRDMYSRLRFYHGFVILILSACGANKQTMTTELAKRVAAEPKPFIPPEYVFVASQNVVKWCDAVVAWTIFYRQVMNVNFAEKTSVQELLNRLLKSGFGDLSYYRWENSVKHYKKFQPQEN